MSEKNNSYEISLKNVILIIQEYFKEILSKWWLIGLITALCLGVSLYKHYTHEITYPYEIKFMVEGESGQSALGGLLGQFAIGQKSTNPVKIQEVGRSNINFEKIAFTKMNGDFVANRIIDLYNLDSQWEKNNENLKGFSFSNDGLTDNNVDKLAFKKLTNFTWKGVGNDAMPLLNINYNFDEGIYRINSNTTEPILSYQLANTLYNYIEDFFENEVLENKIKALEVLNSKADSLKFERDSKNLELARFDDRSVGVINNTYKSRRNIIQQDLLAVSTAYAEVLKNKQLAEFNLNNNKALFLVVDKTLEPITGEKSDFILKIVIGVLVGVFISLLFIVLSKFIRTVMNE